MALTESEVRAAMAAAQKSFELVIGSLREAVDRGGTSDEIEGLARLASSIMVNDQRFSIACELDWAFENLSKLKPGAFGSKDAKAVYACALEQFGQVLDHIKQNHSEMAEMIRESLSD